MSHKVLLAIALLILVVCIGLSFLSIPASKPSSTLLLLKSGPGTAGKIVIPIYSMWSSSGFLSKANIFQNRSQVAGQFQDLLNSPYHPNESVYSGIDDQKPWLSMQSFYVLGTGPKLFSGNPADSIALANPFILVRPDFLGISSQGKVQWDMTRITEDMLRSRDFPFMPLPESLVWIAQEKTAWLSYNITGYVGKLNNWTINALSPKDASFDVMAFNALDFNLSYVGFVESESENVKAGSAGPFSIRQSLGYSQDCDCNTHQPAVSPFKIFQISGMPAKATFYLWTNRPVGFRAEPDIKFQLYLR